MRRFLGGVWRVITFPFRATLVDYHPSVSGFLAL